MDIKWTKNANFPQWTLWGEVFVLGKNRCHDKMDQKVRPMLQEQGYDVYLDLREEKGELWGVDLDIHPTEASNFNGSVFMSFYPPGGNALGYKAEVKDVNEVVQLFRVLWVQFLNDLAEEKSL